MSETPFELEKYIVDAPRWWHQETFGGVFYKDLGVVKASVARQLRDELSAARREIADLRAGMRGECHDAAEEQSGCYRAVKAENELAQARCLLGEWRKLHAAHRPEIQEFKGGYQPFLDRATREFLELKSPAQGATLNAAGQESGEQSPHFARGQENKPTPAAPSTAPGRSVEVETTALQVAPAAVPDDPVAVYTQIRNGTQAGHVDALHNLAAHYMRQAANYVNDDQTYDAILSAAAELEKP